MRVEELTRDHDWDDFDCGDERINDYLKKYACQNKDTNIAYPYALTDNSGEVYGFFTLSTAQVYREGLPESEVKGLPRYPIPAIRIGQMGLDKDYQGKGIGRELLVEALIKSYQISQNIGARIVIVDAINNQVAKFYRKFGFIQYQDDPEKLFISMDTIKKLYRED